MKNTIKGLAFAAILALSLLASTNNAFAHDTGSGRETAWTDLGPVPTVPGGVTWEDVLDPGGVTWE
ncbi:MAG: hypothetical protein E6I44_14830 [Chloroflexi bacterium]|nr:MAG: hypothetical protein E6I44_14830 [Chloroflexota bacterium]